MATYLVFSYCFIILVVTWSCYHDPTIMMVKAIDEGKQQCVNNGGVDGECYVHHPSASDVIKHQKPFIMYGTAWKKERTAALVEQAVLSGFRFIDTACQPKHYHEPGVGEGWTKAAATLRLDRSHFFLQTKFTSIDGQDPNSIPYDKDAPLERQIEQSLEISLRNLRTSYIDSLVMHGLEHTIEDTIRVYRVMESFVENGTVLRLGISNCYDFHVFKAIYDAAKIKPWIIQNRLYDETNFDYEIRRFCQQHGIWYQSFWTLTANRYALATKQIQDWSMEKSLTPQTMMFAFLMQLGYITPLSGTTSIEHMMEDVTIMERLQNGESIFDNEEQLQKFANIIGMAI